MEKLVIKDLCAEVEGNQILKGVNLTINKGETLALLGPNGHGKSTLLAILMGNPRYKVTSGTIEYDGKDLLSLKTDERSKAGLFLAFQNPAEIPGVVSADFFKGAINAHRDNKIKLFEFYKKLEDACDKVNLPFDMVNRNLNDGFSGGEKKRNEILQLLLLNPDIAMLDEIDSGLDVDAINIVSRSITSQKESQNTGFLIISHYARLFELVKPDRAAVMINGRIVKEGDASLISRVDSEGYEWIEKELGISIKKEENDKPMNKVSIGVCATKEVIKDVK